MVDKKRYWLGSVGPLIYDADNDVPDSGGILAAATPQSGIVCEGIIKAFGTPAADEDVLRKVDIGSVTGVTGPGSSTDNAVARWDGAGGNTLQNSGVTIDDSDNVVAAGSITSDAGLLGQVLGDGTAGRVLRQIYVLFEDGTNASTIKCSIVSEWNGDADGPTDNCAKGASTGNFTWNAGGTEVTIDATAFSGDVIMAHGQLAITGAGVFSTAYVRASGGDLLIKLYDSSAAGQDVSSLVDTGNLYISILYLTDA